ncbi:MAG: hypothetical protein SVW77_01595 [Candidatus Nanohaloarchaea archaeon]|nr:hypothetical protein [Candidatus Nanohaloarchaea archaeon]
MAAATQYTAPGSYEAPEAAAVEQYGDGLDVEMTVLDEDGDLGAALWDRLDEAEEYAGLHADVFDSVAVSPELPDEVPAATVGAYRVTPYGLEAEAVFVVNDDFLARPDVVQRAASIHELVEGAQVKDDLGRVLQDELDISDELARTIHQYQQHAPEPLREGMTQAIATRFDPAGDYTALLFYPEETYTFERLLDNQGMDLDEELLEDSYPDQDTGVDGEAYPTVEIGDRSYRYVTPVGAAPSTVTEEQLPPEYRVV